MEKLFKVNDKDNGRLSMALFTGLFSNGAV